jgi:hypothetical protein
VINPLRRIVILSACLVLARASAWAQWAQPDVEIQKLSRLRAKSAATDDLATIKITLKGKWYQPMDSIAKEKAAALGANYLALQQSSGKEEWGAGTFRVYRAVRLADFSGRPLYTRQEEPPPVRPREELSQPVAVAPAVNISSSSSPVAPDEHRHFSWVWQDEGALISHRAIFDPSRAGAADSAELKRYVKENFPGTASTELLRCLQARSRVEIDFQKKSVRGVK